MENFFQGYVPKRFSKVHGFSGVLFIFFCCFDHWWAGVSYILDCSKIFNGAISVTALQILSLVMTWARIYEHTPQIGWPHDRSLFSAYVRCIGILMVVSEKWGLVPLYFLKFNVICDLVLSGETYVLMEPFRQTFCFHPNSATSSSRRWQGRSTPWESIQAMIHIMFWEIL